MHLFLKLAVLATFLCATALAAQQRPSETGPTSTVNATADAISADPFKALFHNEGELTLTSTNADLGARNVHVLPLNSVRGTTLRCGVSVRAEAVSEKPHPWNGIKFMLIVQSSSGVEYPQAEIGTGSFDWQRVGMRIKVPQNATNVLLVRGLEGVTGKVRFKDVTIKAQLVTEARAQARSETRYKGHSADRLRGVMVSPRVTPEDLRVLGKEWKANLIRFQLCRTGQAAKGNAGADYDAWLEGELKRLDALLPVCEESGLRVCLDMHSPPGGSRISGGYYASDHEFFTSRAAQEQFIVNWRRIAQRYKSSPAIWGYDLVNEPVEGNVGEDCLDWQELSERAARAIQEIDPGRAIIVEPADWGSPSALATLRPLPLSNVVYSVHMYLPHTFTHQNVYEKGPELDYPGTIKGKHWDKEELRKALQPVIDFQSKYNVHIYIGEFSAIRWAPKGSAHRYLSDIISLFEENAWDWSYHAFREWNGWSVEHGDEREDTRPTNTPTQRQELLLRWFGKNREQKP